MDKTSSMYLYVKLNWDANRFLPAESKDCMNSASYEYRNMSASTPVHDRKVSALDRSATLVRYQMGYSDIRIQMDMWQYLYGIGYGFIPNAKFCKQLLYLLKSTLR